MYSVKVMAVIDIYRGVFYLACDQFITITPYTILKKKEEKTKICFRDTSDLSGFSFFFNFRLFHVMVSKNSATVVAEATHVWSKKTKQNKAKQQKLLEQYLTKDSNLSDDDCIHTEAE